MLALFLITLSSLMTIIVLALQGLSCTSSTQGLVLMQHNYKSFKTSNPLNCYYECTSDIKCQSINYYKNTQRCELNNRTAGMRPRYVRVDESAVYLDNPYRGQVGSSIQLPGDSCEEIKSVHDSVVSGRYWVVLSGHSKHVYCDMSRKSVVWCLTNPCRNGGTCEYHGDGKYICVCHARFTGINCTDAIECVAYQNITNPDRHVTYNQTADQCDSYKKFTSGWYRFIGHAGVEMPTSCVPINHCNTHAPGWMNGSHPSPSEGAARRNVCFHWNSRCCRWKIGIRVRNCGDYYVYWFGALAFCLLRYCGTS